MVEIEKQAELRHDNPEVGVLDESYSAKPAQLSSHTGPLCYIGWTGSSLCKLAGLFLATPLGGIS